MTDTLTFDAFVRRLVNAEEAAAYQHASADYWRKWGSDWQAACWRTQEETEQQRATVDRYREHAQELACERADWRQRATVAEAKLVAAAEEVADAWADSDETVRRAKADVAAAKAVADHWRQRWLAATDSR